MGLVQLFRDVPCPDVFARHLLDAVLEDFRQSGHHYLMHLVAQRDFARQRGTAEEVAALDAEIHEHAVHEQIPQRWQLDFLFSHAGYDRYGEGILPFWAVVLIRLCTLEQHWQGALLGLPPQNPCLLAGFHPDSEVLDTAWLQDARRTWSEELHAVPPDADEPDEAEEELHDVYLQAASDAANPGPWVH